ncbi:hypothetical protein EYF80_013761 [Liparis tanakae]|uniref:Uncharacterized protein n=1 Tax=Liparis tanakae TaxID=230148 RepID=A0A4Z2IDC8_9TELE|nr:hypothetical protein EYF80_013761 [Liparis tanakae]
MHEGSVHWRQLEMKAHIGVHSSRPLTKAHDGPRRSDIRVAATCPSHTWGGRPKRSFSPQASAPSDRVKDITRRHGFTPQRRRLRVDGTGAYLLTVTSIKCAVFNSHPCMPRPGSQKAKGSSAASFLLLFLIRAIALSPVLGHGGPERHSLHRDDPCGCCSSC